MYRCTINYNPPFRTAPVFPSINNAIVIFSCETCVITIVSSQSIARWKNTPFESVIELWVLYLKWQPTPLFNTFYDLSWYLEILGSCIHSPFSWGYGFYPNEEKSTPKEILTKNQIINRHLKKCLTISSNTNAY